MNKTGTETRDFTRQNNRGIKKLRTIKTILPLTFCMNGLTIMIGQLGLVLLINRNIGREDTNKQIFIHLSIKHQ